MALFTKTFSAVQVQSPSFSGVGYQFVTHIYKLFGFITLYKRDEILALLPPAQ